MNMEGWDLNRLLLVMRLYMIELVITVSYNFFHVIGNNISREAIYSITPGINKLDQFQN